MQLHANAKLGPAGREALVLEILQGKTLKAAAAAFNVAPATAHRWWWRFRQASQAERDSCAWAEDRSSRPLHCPRRLSAGEERPILEARRRTNFGPARLAGLVRRARSTVWKVLWRNGVSRRRRSGPRQGYRRYEWAEPGALLHIDGMQLPKFDRPGHWAHGDRSEPHRSRQAGAVHVIAVVDDRTRLAYAELHGAENAVAVAATLRRAAAWLREQGCGPPEAVMSDNAFCYTRSTAFRAALAELGARHITIPPYTPRWNGKVERFNKTLDEDWAHSRVWPSSAARDKALSSFLRYYNRRRPHTSLGDRPPISRVRNVHGQDN
jgi:transposase InsO family protein